MSVELGAGGDGATGRRGAGRENLRHSEGHRDSDEDKGDRSASSTGSREHPWDRENRLPGWRKAKKGERKATNRRGEEETKDTKAT